jgi:hypothetical protein
MATKKFIIEVEEGETGCFDCPFHDSEHAGCGGGIIDCSKYNLATMKIKEYED